MPHAQYRETIKVKDAIGAIILRRNAHGDLEPDESANLSRATFDPKTQALLLPLADQEYFWNISGASRVEISCRTLQDIRYGYSTNITQGFDYRTLRAGQEKFLDFGTGSYDGNLYFSCSSDNAVIELELWSIINANE